MSKLKEWWRLSTPAERSVMAEVAKTTVGHLQQIMGGWRTNPKLALAVRLCYASAQLSAQNPALPVINPVDLLRPEDQPYAMGN